jgi:hypothetical protein
MEERASDASQQEYSLFSLFLRLYWLLGAVMIVPALAVNIAINSSSGARLPHVLYGVAALSMPLVRFVDIRFFRGQTIDCKPATMSHWVRYSLGVAGLSLAGWVAVALISRFQ